MRRPARRALRRHAAAFAAPSLALKARVALLTSPPHHCRNAVANSYFEANLPGGFQRPQEGARLEQFVRAKYVQRQYAPQGVHWPPSPESDSEAGDAPRPEGVVPLIGSPQAMNAGVPAAQPAPAFPAFDDGAFAAFAMSAGPPMPAPMQEQAQPSLLGSPGSQPSRLGWKTPAPAPSGQVRVSGGEVGGEELRC